MRIILIAMLVSILVLFGSSAAYADTWYHPNSGDIWYCDYYGEVYWCYGSMSESWFRAAGPDSMPRNGWQAI